MRWIFFRGVFGGWSWEQLGSGDEVVAESSKCFDTREDAQLDARRSSHVGAEDAPAASTRHVIIVQRDATLCRDTVRLLPPSHVTVTTSTHEALAEVCSTRVDCIVADCGLRNGELARFCAVVHDVDPRLPVVAYSDEKIADAGTKVLLAGASVFLKRPDDAMALGRTVSSMLQLAQYRQGSTRDR